MTDNNGLSASGSKKGKLQRIILKMLRAREHQPDGLPTNTRVWIAAGHTDMRKGFDGLAALVQTALADNPFCGHVFSARRHAS